MKYNVVSLDQSLISTALVVEGPSGIRMINYCRESAATGKKGMKKWFKLAEQHVEYRFIEYREYANYSEGEIIKLKDYDRITDMIIDDILATIDINIPTKVGIEGYSYSSSAGDIIDLVTFSTLLRKKLFDRVSEDIIVLSPSTLKLETCKLTYGPIVTETGKKVKKLKYEWRNNMGIAGGSFTKTEMLMAIIDNKSMQSGWAEHCRQVKDDLLSVSTIPKPYEDINDAFLIYNVIKSEKPV